jgi:hypothetical protein
MREAVGLDIELRPDAEHLGEVCEPSAYARLDPIRIS